MDYTLPRRDKIVSAVVAGMGLTFETLPLTRYDSWSTDEPPDEDDVNIQGNPSLHIYPDGTTIVRWVHGGERINYTLDDGGGILTIHERETPTTILTAMAGRPLDEFVKVTGGGRMRIVCAVNSKAFVSDPLDTRIQVEDAS